MFSAKPPHKKKPPFPMTVVEVECKGCAGRGKKTVINIRVDREDEREGKGYKVRNCRECNITEIKVTVDPKGGVVVIQEWGMGNRERTPHRQLWQERL